jgi:hypothetical protein
MSVFPPKGLGGGSVKGVGCVLRNLCPLVAPALIQITGSCCITFVGTSHLSILTAFHERYSSRICEEKKLFQKNVGMENIRQEEDRVPEVL